MAQYEILRQACCVKIKLLLTFVVLTSAVFALATLAGHRTFSRQERAMMQPVRSVFDNYFKIASALANDSMDGVASNASAIGSAIRRDSRKMLSPEMAAQADVLAETKDLAGARVVFKRLSNSLIQYLADHKVTGKYVEVYCPIAEAAWLQEKGAKIHNPYLGKKYAGLRDDKEVSR